MITSMTGFGQGSASVQDVTATVEIRSVNKRHCDVSVRLPGRLAEFEQNVQNHIKQAFERGRFNVHIQVEEAEEETLALQVDETAATQYKRLLDDLRAAAGISEPVKLDHLLQFSDVFTTPEETDEDVEDAWEAVQVALGEAIEQLRTMRRDEGRALRDDLEDRVDAIESGLEQVEARAPKRVEEARDRLETRLERLMKDDRINPERLEAEVAVLADKLDVTEECVRLRSHLQQFRAALDNDDAVGRKLKFLTQEIHREVNTIGSKANDSDMTRAVVPMKEEIEKIREQIRNVE